MMCDRYLLFLMQNMYQRPKLVDLLITYVVGWVCDIIVLALQK